MNQSQSGQDVSETATSTLTLKEKILNLDKLIESFQDSVGIPKGTTETSVDEYLNYTRTELEKLSPINCAIIASELSLYNYHLQRKLNKVKARLEWLRSELKLIIGQEARYHNIFSYEEKKYTIIVGNEYATRINHYIVQYESFMYSVENLGLRIDNLGAALKQIGYNKKNMSDSNREF
jgi:hypothetical protein